MNEIDDALLRFAFWQTERALAAIDSAGLVRTWSQGAKTVTGIPAKDALGQKADSFFEDPKELRELRAAAARGQAGRNCPATLRGPGGSSLHCVVSLTPIPETPYWLLSIDPERMPGNENIAENESMLRLERFAAIGRLTASFAHDMRNPLHVITSTAESILEDPANTKGLADDMQLVLKNARAVASTLGALLEFSKSPTMRLKEGRLRPVLDQALGLVEKRLVDQRVALKLSIGRTPPLPMNQHLLRGVFYNIFTNAIEAMPSGGTLTVKSGAGRQGTWVEVRDTGVGMPAPLLARIGRPFFTTKTGGIGLGLYAAKEIARQHQATIGYRANKPRGTCVHIRFPKSPAK